MLHYSKIGSGFPVIFLHGFCENRYLWSHQMNELQSICKTIAFDLSGFGDSPIEINSDNYTIEYLAEQVFESLEEMGLSEYVIIGHSLGGYVALAFAEKYPKRLKGLGMFHSTAFADSLEKKNNRDKAMAFIQRNGVELFANSFVQPLFHRNRREEFTSQIEEAQEVVKQTPKETILLVTEAMKKRPDRTYILSAINCPVLYIIGNQDLAIPLEQSKAQCDLAKESHVFFLDNVSHMGMIEEKEKTTQILKGFIEKCQNNNLL